MFKNVAGQKVSVFAYDASGNGVTGEANNITAYISKDGGASAAVADTNPTELSSSHHPGIYIFDISQTESNADMINLQAICSTGGVTIAPLIIYTTYQWSSTFTLPSSAQSPPTAPTPSQALMWLYFATFTYRYADRNASVLQNWAGNLDIAKAVIASSGGVLTRSKYSIAL
jgi:hypothetical protein